jgi:hypothetical protein
VPYIENGERRAAIDRVAHLDAEAGITPGEEATIVDRLGGEGFYDGGEQNFRCCSHYCHVAPARYNDKIVACAEILLVGIERHNPHLIGAALEIYRRDIGPYENGKAKLNGDLNWPTGG